MGCRLWHLILFIPSLALAQCPVVDFPLPTGVCKQSSYITPAPSVTGATSYFWDFCDGSIMNTPYLIVSNSPGGITDPYDLKYVEESGNNYVFVVNYGSGKLTRFDFGLDLASTPVMVDLGNFGVVTHPLGIGFWVESNSAFALLVTETGSLFRLSFGNSVANLPTVTPITGITGLTDHRQMKIVQENGSVLALIAGGSTGEVSMLNFGSSILNQPTKTSISVPNYTYLIGLDVLVECNSKYALVTDYGKGMSLLSFGSSFLNAPTITQPSGLTSGSMLGLSIVKSKGNYHALVSQQPTGIFRLDFGSQLTNPNPTRVDLGTFGGATLAIGHTVAQHGAKYYSISINNSDGTLRVLDFPKDCDVTGSFQNNPNPLISFSQSGTFAITLSGVGVDGQFKSVTKDLVVDSKISPAFSIDVSGLCFGYSSGFNGQQVDGQPISNISWDFGDGNFGNGQNAQHQYASLGPFPIGLNAIGSNGCVNRLSKDIKIYNKPSASFSLPPGQICTNNEFTFVNSTMDNFDGFLSYQWQVDGVNAGSARDLKFTLTSLNDQQVTLVTSIPGCSDAQTQTATNIKVGPTVGFNILGNCKDGIITFTNTSSGSISGYSWNFGNGQTSANVNESQVYALPGDYSVSLQTTSSNGCVSYTLKNLKIFSLPQPNFSTALPPFSCANSLTPFQNTTPALTDSNITAWAWQFGDSQGGSSNQQSPSYTYVSQGNFTAVLTATSDAGCSASVSKSITISTSPAADFVVGPACVNQSTKFTDLSTGGVQSRLWQIGTGSFSSTNPSYTFTSSGSNVTTLTVTGANNCSNTKTRTVTVPVVPSLNYTVTNPCAGKNAVFTDQTASPTDGVVGWNWNFAGNSLTGNPAACNFSSTGTYDVKMTTTHASGCRYTLAKSVVINPTPVAGFTAAPDRGAAPLTVQFTNTSQQATGFAWKFYDKVTATSTRISPVYTFTSLGDYSAELTATNAQGCSDLLTVPIKVLVPSIDLIMKDFTLASDPVTGKIKCIVTILNNSNIPIISSEVTLFLADKAVVNETLILNLSPGQSATSALSFTLSPNQFDFTFLCAEVSTEKDVQTDNNKKCVNLEGQDYFFNPYPNPSAGVLQIDWISQKAGSAHIVVYDGMGRRMYDWQTMTHAGLNQTVLDLTFLSAGSYFVTIETSVSRKTTRFLRQ